MAYKNKNKIILKRKHKIMRKSSWQYYERLKSEGVERS